MNITPAVPDISIVPVAAIPASFEPVQMPDELAAAVPAAGDDVMEIPSGAGSEGKLYLESYR
jgi:hypothetical protein